MLVEEVSKSIKYCWVGYLRSEEKDNRESKDEACDTEVHPLNCTQIIRADISEEDERREYRCYDTADSLESLSEVETELHPSWRTTCSLI